jgi:hypothetical protein
LPAHPARRRIRRALRLARRLGFGQRYQAKRIVISAIWRRRAVVARHAWRIAKAIFTARLAIQVLAFCPGKDPARRYISARAGQGSLRLKERLALNGGGSDAGDMSGTWPQWESRPHIGNGKFSITAGGRPRHHGTAFSLRACRKRVR